MSVHVVECARGTREGGSLVISLEYQGSDTYQAIKYAQDHNYRARRAWEIYREEDLPPKPLAVIQSFKRRNRD